MILSIERKIPGFFLLPLLVILVSIHAYSAEDYSDWAYSQTFILNTTSSGANVSENVHNFPLLVRLNPGTFRYFSQTETDGADIRFAKNNSTHTPLSYQIERWDDNTGDNDTAEIWVKIDTVYGFNATQGVVMYWGKTDATDSSDNAAVFPGANGFLAAYHLAGNLNDASSNGKTGVDSGTIDTSTGIIGRARSFTGTSFFQAGDLPDRTSGTISCWFRTKADFNSSVKESWGIWGKKTNDGNNASLCLRGNEYKLGSGSAGQLQGKIEYDNASVYINSSTALFTSGTWYHVAWSWGNSAESLFVNGTLQTATSGSPTVAGTANDEIGGTYYDPGNVTYSGRYYFYGTLDEFRIDNTVRSANWIKLSFENQRTDQKFLAYSASYTWDISATSGIQTGSGTWGSNNYWSLTDGSGTALFPWAGAGSFATFAGTKGSYIITVSGKQYVDSISFLDSGYTLDSGTIDLGNSSGVYIDGGVITRINSVITGSVGLSKYGGGYLYLYGTNTYTGNTAIKNGHILALANAAIQGDIRFDGSSGRLILADDVTLSNNVTVDVANPGVAMGVIEGPEGFGETATFSGAITLNANASTGGHFHGGNTSGGLHISGAINAGTGIKVQTRAGRIKLSGGGAYESLWLGEDTLRLGASNGISTSAVVRMSTVGTSVLNLNGFNQTLAGIECIGAMTAKITNTSFVASTLTLNLSADYSFPGTISGNVALVKQGSATQTLSGTNTYFGSTSIAAGKLLVNGSVGLGSAVAVTDGATLGGTGTCSGTVTVEDGTIAPGDAGAGKLSIGALTLNETSVLQIDLGTKSDTIAVTGALTLDGTINFTAAAGFGPDTFRIMTFTGVLTNNTLVIGTEPSNANCTLVLGDGYLSVVATASGLIKTEPKDTVAIVGQSVSFTVTAEVTGEPHYSWLRYPGQIVGDAITATLSLPSVSLENNGERYLCIVSDDLKTDSSEWALLTVIDTPRIITKPQNLTAAVGTDAVFSLSVTDTSRVTYSWRIPGSDSVLSTTDSLTVPAVTFSDSGSRYFCLVTNPVATVSTDTVELIVSHIPPSITFQPVSRSVVEGDSVRFTVAASGNAPPSYAWRKAGADSILGSAASYRIATTVLTDSGDYYCTVVNPGGTLTSDTAHLTVGNRRPDVVFTFTPKTGQAPLQVSFTNASTGAIDEYLWRFGDGGMATEINPTHVYTKAGRYDVTLIVTGSGGVDSLVKPDSIFVYGSNPIRMTARFLSGTDVEITLDDIDSIDTLPPSPACDSIGVWFKAREMPADSSDGTLIDRYRREMFRGAKIVDTLTLPTTDTIFGLMSGLFWDNGSLTSFLEPSGAVVLLRDTVSPVNNCAIAAEAIGGDSIRVMLSNIGSIDTGRVDSLCIWYGADTTDLSYTGNNIRWYAVGSFPDSVEKNLVVHDMIFTGASHTLYIAVVLKGNNDRFSAANIDSFVTSPGDTGLVNSVAIDTIYFDSLSASIRISWCIDEKAMEKDPEVGITYSLTRYPDNPAGNDVITLHSRCTDAIVRLHEPLQFNSLYYVALWLRFGNGIWIEPTDGSKKTVEVGSYFREVVTYFDSSTTNDTVTAFNGQVVLWKDDGFGNGVTTDTLEIVSFDTIPRGMVPVGIPFSFINGEPEYPFFIGIRIDSLPKDLSISDVRIYSDSAGKLSVDYETAVDSVHGIVFIKTGKLRRSFIAMADIAKPEVSIQSDIKSPVFSTSKLSDSLTIVDNIANVRWKYFYGRGDEAPQLREHGFMHSADTNLNLDISESIQVISSESGLRALLIIDDGIHSDTINLSRSVFRNESDKLTTTANIWNPVYPTAELTEKDAGPLIGQLLDHDNLKSYDQRYMRLYRWFSCEENEGETDKWVEYDQDRPTIQSLFTLEPGKMVWLKTRDNVPLHLDSGYTLSLKDTFTIDLPSGQWTDFGMPYRFSVRMEDVLSATGEDADSVLYYRWIRDSLSNIYTLEPLYVPGMPDKADRSKTIDYLPGGGYSFYNRHSKTVKLRIPPILPAMTRNLAKTAKNKSTSWSMKFVALADDHTRLPAVYFGYAPGIANRRYPLSPTFAALRLSVFDRSTAESYGHYISENAENGLVGELRISNSTDSLHSIKYHLESSGAFPEGYTAFCFDAAAKKLDTSGTVIVAPKSAASRWIVVGDAAFQEKFISSVMSQHFSLRALYPNPARSKVNIRYTVPFGAQERIRIAIYNMLGKKVWEKKINGLLDQGTHLVTWDSRETQSGTAGSGVYIVRLTVENEHGKAVRQFEKRMTLLR